jgi:thiol-disulfide isomerase/thioredoxin
VKRKIWLVMMVLFTLLSTSCNCLRDLSSRSVEDPLATFPGNTQVLIYWYKACPYCEQQLAEIEAVYDRWSGMGIVVVAIDVGDPRKDVLKTVEERGYSFPVLWGAGWDDLETRAVPYTVVHVNGKVIGRRIGYLSIPEIEGMLKGEVP